MPVLSLSNTRILEGDRSFESALFRVTLDEAASAPVSFRYYTTDGTASAARGDYNERTGDITIQPGTTSVDIPVTVYGGTGVEADETFHVVLQATGNATLAGGAAALVGTGIILDDDDGIPTGSTGVFGTATGIFGPTPEAGFLPTVTLHDVTVIEGDRSFEPARFLVTLDRPATADVTVSYHVQSGLAGEQTGDIYDRSGTLTIAAGQQSSYISVNVVGGTGPEADETFDVVLTGVRNGVFSGGAEAIAATATILDDDSGRSDLTGGIGDPGEEIRGPASTSPLPTFRVQDVSFIEGDSGFEAARLLVTLDQPSNSPITVSYYTQDGSAGARTGDYSERTSTFTMPAGSTSTYVTINVYGDQLLEGNEDFSVVFAGIQGGRFENDAPALEARVAIIEDDIGPVSGPGGVGNPAVGIEGPESTAPIVPVLQVHDASLIEGDNSFESLRFLVTMDRPAPAPVTFSYVTMDGTAGDRSGDYADRTGTVTIPAGQQSTWITVNVYGDTVLEGDEDFSLFLYRISNANFVGNAPALVARGTIIDDDGGTVTRPAGVDDPAAGVRGPVPDAAAVSITPVAISVIEGSSSSHIHYVPVLLSEPARGNVVIDWRTVATGTATADVDFNERSGQLTIPAGAASGVIGITVYGDTAIEGDETFGLELTNASNVLFANGENSITSEIRIVGDDGAGTTGASPDFDLGTGATEGADQLLGSFAADVLAGNGGNDTISGLNGDDTLSGNEGNDLVSGGEGNDVLSGDDGNDTLNGGNGADRIAGGTGDDLIIGGTSDTDLRDVVFGGAGNDTIDGGYGNDELRGDAGNDNIAGGFGADTVIGGTGNDTLTGSAFGDEIFGGDGMDFVNGGFGSDRVNGGDGADLFFHLGIRDHGSDWIQDYSATEGDVLVFGGAATAADFQINRAFTASAGDAGTEEAFVIYRPTGQIIWALVDGMAEDSITLRVGGVDTDLLA
ncbi:Calx-beta domain-containing protein [Jannaschia sp. 2305UL9-9]|uniref:Calx-beta domain-containing protein n=1 Tax=Jannaschia sp. 2305UL9-9 TaxID=3121638 RepID=UPI003526DE47